jgi:hypothetical protein
MNSDSDDYSNYYVSIGVSEISITSAWLLAAQAFKLRVIGIYLRWTIVDDLLFHASDFEDLFKLCF